MPWLEIKSMIMNVFVHDSYSYQGLKCNRGAQKQIGTDLLAFCFVYRPDYNEEMFY